MNPLSVPCPTCKAPVDDKCFQLGRRHPFVVIEAPVTGARKKSPHPSRSKAARELARENRTPHRRVP